MLYSRLSATRPWRFFRRARARWRRHRIDWNNYYANLEPPKGYEKYYTIEEALPAMKELASFKDMWNMTREEKIRIFKISWRVYRHSWTYDPQMARLLDELGLIKMPKTDEQIDEEIEEATDKGVAHVKDLRKRAKKSLNIISTGFEEMRPDLERLGKDRVVVMQTALREFSEGYVEASSGVYRPPWSQYEEERPMYEPDNRPVRYEVVGPDDECETDQYDEPEATAPVSDRKKS